MNNLYTIVIDKIFECVYNYVNASVTRKVNGMKNYKLSNSEEYLLELFWQENRPLTSVDLVEIATQFKWSSNYIHKIIGLLQNKGLIEMCGVTKEGKHYIRQFVPSLSKEEYLSEMLLEKGVGTLSFAKIAMSFVKKGTADNEEQTQENLALISELEDIITRFEEEHKEET